MGYIYKITNTINNKSYVGVTIQLDGLSRFKSHMSAIRSGKGCPLLQKAVNKYGEATFRFQILIICFDEDVFKYEKEYIMKYNAMSPTGYNVAEGGKSGRNFLGKTHSEETREKIGKKSKEYGNRPEVKERSRQNMIKLNEKRKNGDISEKWKEAIKSGKMGGTCNKGRKVKEDVKKKISEGLKAYFNNKKIPEDDIGRKNIVLQYEKHVEGKYYNIQKRMYYLHHMILLQKQLKKLKFIEIQYRHYVVEDLKLQLNLFGNMQNLKNLSFL